MSRLQTEKTFSVEVDEADRFFPGGEAPPASKLRDFYSRTGAPMVRADSIRALHPDCRAARPLKGRETELLDRLTHPYVLRAREAAQEARVELDECSNFKRAAGLATELRDALDEVEEKADEIDTLTDRIDDGKTLDAEQLSTLLDREVAPKDETLTTVDGETLHASKSYEMGTMRGDRFGSSALWSAEDARRLYHDLPVRLLRNRARKVEEKPQERSIGQHIAAVGVERLVEEAPHFSRQPTRLLISNLRKNGSTPSTPRKRKTPSSL